MDRNSESLRIVFDLQAGQVPGYYQRGVGNYSLGLFDGLSNIYSQGELFSLVSAHLPHSPDHAGIRQDRLINLSLPASGDLRCDFEGGTIDSLGSIAYSAQCNAVKPDVIHVAHNFLDYRDGVIGPGATQPVAGQILSTTLYDLIPLKFPELYLRDETSRRRYQHQLQKLRRFDLLLAISESTRKDAIELLDLDPERVVAVHGDVGRQFKTNKESAATIQQLRQKYVLAENIVLYTGGDDVRKNISGLINAFSELPADVRSQTTLVVVGKFSPQSEQSYRKAAHKAGLKESDLVFTGFVPDEQLIAWYQACSVFVFPSCYEGLGLPILEAMNNGAPVIGSDNSSIRELIRREDALFDPYKPQSIAEVMHRALSDRGFARQLKENGSEQAAKYSWEKTADLASHAIEEALARKRKSATSFALSGELKRKRIAVLTPLPPCESGIADYASAFLPYLSRHFDIDLYLDGYRTTDIRLLSLFRVFDIKDFAASAPRYDVILYEIGNSDFHTHMLELLERFPGVVTLHDAYMSGILAHLELSLNQEFRYQKELLYSHGPRARQYIAPNTDDREALGVAIDLLPTTKRILDHALGIISHSPFNLEIARQNYPEGWLAPYKTVPQLMHVQEVDDSESSSIKKELKIPKDAFVIATFGHVVWTKRGDLLLDAFLESKLFKNKNTYLIFVGKLADNDFGQRLKKAISGSKAGKRIRITGFASTDEYQKYLKAADIAVQLRTSSRGGTPRSVLDCLASGLPVIVNDYASFTDYPDEVAVKIAGKISTSELREKLDMLYSDPERLRAYAQSGIEYVREHHSPTYCAAQYAAAIHEFLERDAIVHPQYYERSLIPLISSTETEMVARAALDQVGPHAFNRRRLIIDVSHIAQSDHQTGIQRIVRELVSALYACDIAGIEPMAVELIEGELVPARDWLVERDLCTQFEIHEDDRSTIEFGAGDILIMLDSSWDRYEEFYPVFERARSANVPIIGVVYDILPIRIPECFVEGGPAWFETWFTKALANSDGLICISEATQNDVRDYIEAENIAEPPKIGFWHHGSDFDPGKTRINTTPPKPAPDPNNYLLMVGTIEPRKLHNLAISVMQELWDRGIDLQLCIAGKAGWMVDEVISRIEHHDQTGKRLFFIESPSDEALKQLYSDAAGLLFLSKGEGFGLPLLEAAKYGRPIICSDIAAFREVAQDHAYYTRGESAAALAENISDWLTLRENDEHPKSTNMPINSCRQSAEEFIHTLFNDLNI